MFNKVAVIGAGTMGAGIAGQVANAGVDVLLLDLAADGDDVNAPARRGLVRIQDPEQPGLMSDDVAARITLGNIRDDLHLVADCDWVAEAVVERLDIKHQLYRNLATHMRDDAILTSNTSTIPIRLLTDGMDDALKERFAITHFFNPVRFMRLLELVRGEKTRPDIMERLEQFSEERLGKGVVNCADTPGFLANRVGVYAIQCALHEAFKAELKPQIADALFGRPMGIPKTGVFGLYDLIGIDLMSDVAKSLVNILPEQDAFHAYSAPIDIMTNMIAEGKTGNKQGKGFYLQQEDGIKQVLDFASNSYIDFNRPSIAIAEQAERDGIRCLLDDDSEYGQYAWKVLSNSLCYAASLIPEVGDDPLAIDDAMKLGYNWIKGPFELIDEIGLDYFIQRLEKEGRAVPAFLKQLHDNDANSTFYSIQQEQYGRQLWQETSTEQALWKALTRSEGTIRFNEARHTLKPINSNASASWFAYEGVALVEFHTKANALDSESMAIVRDALENAASHGLAGIVVHNDAQHFSCGVNLEAVRGFFQVEDYDGLDNFLDDFQKAVHQMASSQLPVVAAPVGLSIGGGFEVVLHAQHVVANANSVTGLVESLVGVVPGGGGCKEILYRWMEKLALTPDNIHDASWKAFMNVGYGRTATSPVLSKKLAMLRPSDTFLMNRDRQLQAAIAHIHNNQPVVHAQRPTLTMPGREVYQAMAQWLDDTHAKGHLTPHDTIVGRAIASIMSGGDIDAGTQWTEQDLYDAERRAFLQLVQTSDTQARINSMLDLGRTLRN